MKLNKKIVLSSVAAALALSFTACGGGGGGGTTPPPTTTASDAQTIVDNGDFTGSGALQAATRYVANDDTFALPSTVGLAAADTVDQAAIKALADLKGAPDTTILAAGTLTGTVNLTKNTVYEIGGLVKVGNGATLNIEPGTIIYGDTGANYIVVMQGGTIVAEGTEAEPIIFTSSAALADASTAAAGQWGGLTILGNAPTNQTAATFYEVNEADPDFEFGGTAANDNSGSLKYVQILNSGSEVATDQEINGLSLCGVGTGTTIENIHVENSSDDGIEIWGGTVDVTNATIINALDDSFDLDYGYIGTATNISVTQTEAAHAGFEISSGGTSPMTSPTIVNFSINKVAGSDEGGIYIKDDSTAPTFVNGIVTTYGTDAAVNAKLAMQADQEAALSFKDVVYSIK